MLYFEMYLVSIVTMWLGHVLYIFIVKFCMVNGIGIFDLGNGYKLLEKELSLAGAMGSSAYSKIQTRWMEQPLDHFDSKENRMWLMRYFERLDLWKANGPIYIFIGGEGEASRGFLTGGMIYDLSNETNGAMFMSEHRYYGKSVPLKYTGVKSLKYLSSRQAMADLARMISRLKMLPLFKKSKVVLIGGSYSGNLAVWMKLLYPNLIDAALASSAPVLAKKNFYEYLETVSDVYEQYGTNGCHDFIEKQFTKYEKLLSSDAGITQLKKEENICSESDMKKEENKQLFVYGMASWYMANTQYGNEKKIQQHCNEIMNASRNIGTAENRIVRINWLEDLKPVSFWNKNEKCYDVDFDGIIEEIKTRGDWLTSWVYQMCTEFSYAKSTSSNNQPFSKYIPIETFYKICALSFGDNFDEDAIEKIVNNTNEMYGGLKPNVKNVIFINGDMDPWHRLGVLEDISYDAVAKVIPRSSHCLDLLPNRKGDSEELRETRSYIKYIIKKWIGIEPWDDVVMKPKELK